MNFKNIKSGTITVFEKTVKGLWLRNPFYRKGFDVFEGEDIILEFKKSIRIWFFQTLVVRLLNSPTRMKELREFVKEDSAAGFYLWTLRNPFYFEREEKELFMKVDEYTYLHSWGFNYTDEQVGGYCTIEITKGKINGIPFKNKEKKTYKYTYKHVVEEFLKKQRISLE